MPARYGRGGGCIRSIGRADSNVSMAPHGRGDFSRARHRIAAWRGAIDLLAVLPTVAMNNWLTQRLRPRHMIETKFQLFCR